MLPACQDLMTEPWFCGKEREGRIWKGEPEAGLNRWARARDPGCLQPVSSPHLSAK